MTHRSIRLALCVLGLAVLGREAGAQTRALDPDPSLGVAGATTPTTTAVAPHDGHHAPAALPVPPELEIQVLAPNVDPLGNPAVLTRTDPTGRVVVDIPPSCWCIAITTPATARSRDRSCPAARRSSSPITPRPANEPIFR